MTLLSGIFRASSIGGLLLAGSLTTAAAQDVDAVLDRLQVLLAEQGVEFDWSETEIDGNDVTLRGVGFEGPEGRLEMGDFLLTGISQIDEGYRIEEMSMPLYAFDDDGISGTFEGLLLTGVVLPDEGAGEEYGGIFFYETAELSRMQMSMDGTEVFALDDFHIQVSPVEGDTPIMFTGTADSFTADLSTVEDAKSREIIQRMGYERISGRFEMAGSWQPADGRMAVSQFDLTVEDGGTLGFAIDIGGYTREFVRALGEAQSGGDSSMNEMAMLGLLQQLSLHGLDIYFYDDALTGKVLEVVAAEQGMRPSDIVNQAKAILPFMLAQLGVPELATMIADAVSQYLDDPQSIRISLQPAAPVPFATLMAGAMASPQALVEQLAVEIVANE